MSNRFYVNHPPQVGTEIQLDPLECHHVINVMRGKSGENIELFDGSGFVFAAEIREVTRKSVSVYVQSKHHVDRELESELVIGIPVPKGDRQKFLVEKLTELGVTRLVLTETARSSVKANEKTVEKLARAVIEACKQCGRNRLMQIEGPFPLEKVIARQEFQAPGFDNLFAHLCQDFQTRWVPMPLSDKVVLIGPEGGWDAAEIQLLKSGGWKPINLGKAILRMETAAVAGATLLGNGLSNQG